MSKLIKNILVSLVLVSTLTTFTSCGSSDNNTTNTQQTTDQSKPHRDVSSERKPQISGFNGSSTQSIYKDGEIVTLADGSKLKYSSDGNHELLEKGDGIVVIFKTATQEELNSLTPEQKSLVERQMKSDPNGFTLVY